MSLQKKADFLRLSQMGKKKYLAFVTIVYAPSRDIIQNLELTPSSELNTAEKVRAKEERGALSGLHTIVSDGLTLGARRLKNRSVSNILENSSTGATMKATAEVDFSKKPNTPEHRRSESVTTKHLKARSSIAPTGFKVGYAVSKRLGNAPMRNRIKRRLRAAISKASQNLELNYDMLLIAKKTALDIKFNDLALQLKNFFNSLKNRCAK